MHTNLTLSQDSWVEAWGHAASEQFVWHFNHKKQQLFRVLCPLLQAVSGTAAAAAAPQAAAAAAGVAKVPVAAVGAGRAAAERVITTAKFLRQMGRKGEFKKEVAGFAARWVHGTGEACSAAYEGNNHPQLPPIVSF
jgi:hypothetical protein